MTTAATSASIFVLLVIPVAGLAATPPRLPSTVEPGHEAPPSTEVPEAQFDFSITARHPSALPKDVESLRFAVRKITIEGSTVFRHGDFLPLVEPLIGPQTSLAEIMAVAAAIEGRYREEGFLLTRAYVPQQRSKDGQFTIQVIEAYIKNIVVEGVDGDLKDRIEAMLAPVQNERPLTSSTMERALLLVNEINGVHAVGLLKPSADEVGAADLQVTVSQQTLAVSAGIDNRASRYSGPWIATGDVAVNSLANSGEQIGGGITRSLNLPKQQRGYRGHYIQPIGDGGLTATTAIDRTLGQPGYTLGPLGITTDSLTISERLSYPLILNRHMTLFIDAGVAWKSAKTDALQDPITYDQWRVADIKLSFSQTGWGNGVTAASFDVVRGLPIEHASHLHDPLLSRGNGDPDFTKFVFDVRRVQPLWSDFSLTLAAAGQHAYTGLLAGEQFALGGYQYGRGFDPAALTGDNGLAGTAELHYDTRVPLLDTLQTFVFYDRGVLRNHDSLRTESLSSVGIGLRAPLSSNVDIAVEADRPLHGPVPTMNDHPARVFLSIQGRM